MAILILAISRIGHRVLSVHGRFRNRNFETATLKWWLQPIPDVQFTKFPPIDDFMNGPIAWYHGRFIHQRRVEVLSRHLADLIVPDASVLDVGCGDGLLSARLQQLRPDLSVSGIDVLVRPDAKIEVVEFDGKTIPIAKDGVDVVLMVDVLHHTDVPGDMLKEAARVSKKQVIIKDHYLQGFAAHQTLSMMDNVGNTRHGVEIPCNYQTPEQWTQLYQASGLQVAEMRNQLGLYLPPLNWFFERSLHFIASLEERTKS
ncbi:class I SAM-dependent methyltransferase [Rubripirellula amarantea]|uniref:class I SAM-dependent methyltransferase n=1 Tax=Rubripirellula amarantea TaxID=2527999 RepID=UPI001A94B37E|nr:class I SAM-dependent methyltransferase [Rubripirellula amarantea]